MAYHKHNIVNGQYVHIEQTPASIGHRIGAQLIDTLLIYGYYNIAVIVFGSISIVSAWDMTIVAIVLLIPIFYTPACEQLFHGATIGKRAFHMRVVMQSGEPVTIGASILRAMLCLIDIDFLYAGLLVMFCNKRNMRLGDLAAGTIVIKESTSAHQVINPLRQFTYLSEKYQPTYPFAAELTWGQIDFINHTMRRTPTAKFAPNQKENIAMLAQKIASKYNITGLTSETYNRFLRTIVADYNYYTWNDTV